MTAECGVIYSAGEALCGRKSILQHRANPKRSGKRRSQSRSVKFSQKREGVGGGVPAIVWNMILTHARFQTQPACNLIFWFPRQYDGSLCWSHRRNFLLFPPFLKRSQVKLCYGTAPPTASVPLLRSSKSRPQCRLKQKLPTAAYNHFDTFFFFFFLVCT